MNERTWQVGDEDSGFLLVQKEDLADYRGTGYLFRHIATNMEVFQIVNDDSERFFSYVFRTLPNNDCGVAHILEHSVLAGSKNYPVRDPFMTLLKGSTNTYMNAMTFPDKTLYPGASPLKKDFDNLFPVYTDAVFAPLLREETFQQEGVRLVCDAQGCHFEGVVFNEMLGEASDHDSIVGWKSIRSLFPDTVYSFDSGGEPQQIVNLDYQQFLAFYGRFYHPSNCRLFLYGDLPVGDRLSYLDRTYLAAFNALKVEDPPSLSLPWAEPRKFTFTSPLEEGEEKGGASVVLSWATTEVTDELELITLSTLVDILLGNPGSPLYKALLETGLAPDISPECGMSANFREMPFIVGFKGIDAERADEAETSILEILAKLAKYGIGKDVVASAVKRARFSQKEVPGGMPNGLRALNRCLHGWLYGSDPFATVGISRPLDLLESALADDSRYFEHWIKAHLLENPHRCLVTVTPDKEHESRQQEAISRNAAKIMESMGKKATKTLEEQNERFQRFEQEGDTPEALATVPRLHIADLPPTVPSNDHSHEELSGRKLFIRPRFCNGIVYADFAFGLDDLDERELLLMPLYSRLIQMTGLGKMDYAKVATRIRNLTGDFSLFVDLGSTMDASDENGRLLLMGRVKALEGDFSSAMTFIGRLLRDADVGNRQRIKAVVSDLRSDFADSVTYNAHGFASLKATSVFGNIQYEGEALSGLDQWFFLNTIDDAALPGVAEELLALQHKLSDRRRLVLHLTCDEAKVPSLVRTYGKFVSSFPEGGEGPLQPRTRSYADVASGDVHAVCLYRLPSSVSYASYVLRSSERGSRLQAAQTLLAQILTGNDLWEDVRGKGGAYGVSAHADVVEQLFLFSSYRDPRIAGTLADFKRVLSLYADKAIEPALIENAVISLVGQDLRPLSPSQDAILAFRRLLYGIDDSFRAMRRKQLLSICDEDIHAGAKALLEASGREDSYVVLAGGQLLEKEREKDSVLARPAVRLPL